MTLPREQIPESVWRAREVDSLERGRAEDDYQRHLASLKPVRKPSQRDELIAIVSTGRLDFCPSCGGWAEVVDGIHVCRSCGLGWDRDDA